MKRDITWSGRDGFRDGSVRIAPLIVLPRGMPYGRGLAWLINRVRDRQAWYGGFVESDRLGVDRAMEFVQSAHTFARDTDAHVIFETLHEDLFDAFDEDEHEIVGIRRRGQQWELANARSDLPGRWRLRFMLHGEGMFAWPSR
jgi:hypothetical protein